MAIDPRGGHAYYLLALCAEERWRRTIAELVEARRAPDDEAARARVKTLVQKERGQAEQAVDLFHASLKLEPHALDCIRDLAILLYDQAVRHVRGKSAQALAEFREVAALLDRLLELLPPDEKTRPDVMQKRETVKGRISSSRKAPGLEPARRTEEVPTGPVRRAGAGRGDSMSRAALLLLVLNAGARRRDARRRRRLRGRRLALGGQLGGQSGDSWSTYAGLVEREKGRRAARRTASSAARSSRPAVGTIEDAHRSALTSAIR